MEPLGGIAMDENSVGCLISGNFDQIFHVNFQRDKQLAVLIRRRKHSTLFSVAREDVGTPVVAQVGFKGGEKGLGGCL